MASGEALAVFYQGASALEHANEIRALQLQISAAEAAAGASSAARLTGAAGSVLALSDAVRHKNFEELPSISMTVENMIFTNAGSAAQSEDLPSLQAEAERSAGTGFGRDDHRRADERRFFRRCGRL